MRQRLQRLDPIQQLLLLHVRFSPVLLQRLFCLVKCGFSRIEQGGFVVFDSYVYAAEQQNSVTSWFMGEIHPIAVAIHDIQLDGLFDSCHDYLGFSLLTFSPSLARLFSDEASAPAYACNLQPHLTPLFS